MLCYFSYPKQAYIEDNNNCVLMPTLLDITGFDNDEIEINKEVLSIFLMENSKNGKNYIVYVNIMSTTDFIG